MNYSRQDEVFCPPVSTVNGGSAFSRHISRPIMDNPKDDVFSRPPVPGLNGLPRERKHRFSGNGGGSPSAGLLRIKIEPQAAFPINGGGTSPYSSQQPPLIPPNCIKSESVGMAFKRYESYPPPGSPMALVSGNSHAADLIQPSNGSTNSVHYQQNMRRYSLPEYKLHQLHEPPHPDILTPLNLTRRSSSSEIVHASASPSTVGRPRYHSYQGSAATAANSMFQTATASSLQLLHPDVKRELPDGDYEPDGLHNHFVFGGGSGHEDHLPPHLQQQRSRLSLSSSKCRQNGGEDPSVEAVYRDYGGRKQETDYDAVSPSRPISGGGSSNVEVYRGEFESSRMREAADGPTAGGMTAKKEPDLDGKSSAGSAGNRGSGRTIIEFDGNDCVLCRVCGDKASGFHYGVHSCEGCKGFFRRSIQQKIQYRPCNKNQQCSILRINRNRCQYCRLKKCISAGMSRDAVRFGRVPKREKAKILAAMQSSKAKVLESRVGAEMADDRKIIDTIVRAHYDTCDYTVDKIKPFVERAHASPKLTQCTGQRCPLKGSPEMSFLDEFSDRFMDHVRQVCTFAKLIPGFKCLQHDDQVTLLKSCVFEVLTVRLSGLFDNQSLVCMNGDVIRRETISAMPAGNAKFLMDNVFELTQRINRFQLSDAEIGLFCAVVIISADRPGLRNAELVGRMQTKLKNILQSILVPQHPRHSAIFTELIAICQDLRTLNTLHTEKFLLQAKVMRDEVGGSLTPSSLASSSPLPPSSSSAAVSVSVAAQHAILGQSYVDREWEENANCSTGSLDRDSTGSRSPQSSSDSPATSHSFSMEDLRRSPLGSVSSSESIANSETFSKLSVNDLKIHGSVLLNALTSPALSAQLAGAVSQSQSVTGGRHIGSVSSHHHQQHPLSRKRELSRSESGSSSTRQTSPSPREQDTSSSSNTSAGHGHHHHGGHSSSSQESKCPYKARKLDSPSDSGIDSPKAQGSHSTNTSVCSSPRSSMEDGAMLPNAGDDNEGRPDLEEQHPLLKRALQQPPQPFNMGGGISNFQDEVYKPHKKFRHSDRKDGDEPTSSTQDTGSSGSVSPGSSSSSLVHSHSILASQLAAPPTYQRRSSPPPASAASNSISALLAAAAANSSMVSSSQQMMAGSSGITTLSRGAPPTHHQSLLATTLSRPVAVARAKRDEERSELLANLILDSGRYRPPPSSHHLLQQQQHHNQKSQSLLMCAITTPSSPSASPLPAHTATELAARGCWSPAGAAAAASVAASSSSSSRHLPVPVAPSHSTTTSSPSLSGSLNASSLPRGLAAAAVASAQKKSTATANSSGGFSCSDSEDSMPLNLCVKSPASPSSVKSDQDATAAMFGASAVKKEPLTAVTGVAVDSSE